MGSSQSTPSPPPPPPPPPSESPLNRTLTNAAHEIITDGIRKELRDTQTDVVRFKRWVKECEADLEDALHALESQKRQHAVYGLAAAGVSAAIAAAVGATVARRQASASLLRLSQELVDLKQRSASELAKSERFGGAKLAKSLIPALDAMDALCDAGGGDEEGGRITRAAFHDALRTNGVERIEPAVGYQFDYSVMEASASTTRARFHAHSQLTLRCRVRIWCRMRPLLSQPIECCARRRCSQCQSRAAQASWRRYFDPATRLAESASCVQRRSAWGF